MENQHAYQSFTELEAWKSARELRKEIYSLVTKFPKEERYNLTDQLIRLRDLYAVILQKVTEDIRLKINYIFAFKPEDRYQK